MYLIERISLQAGQFECLLIDPALGIIAIFLLVLILQSVLRLRHYLFKFRYAQTCPSSLPSHQRLHACTQDAPTSIHPGLRLCGRDCLHVCNLHAHQLDPTLLPP
jgi:hypothetical protein